MCLPQKCQSVYPKNGNPKKDQTEWGEWGAQTDWGEWGEQTDWGEWGEQTDWGEWGDQTNWGEHVGSPLHRVVQWFKTMTTNEYVRGVKNLGWKRFDGKLWQRNYYERIISNNQAFIAISRYIMNNPAKWNDDKSF